MRSNLFIGLAVSTLTFTGSMHGALAFCSGASSPVALQSFNSDPKGFISSNKGKSDVGAQVTGLAAAATNSKDAGFGKNLGTMLANAGGDDGKAIGTALAGLGSTCTDPKDPGNREDKQYISRNIEPNLLTNVATNAAYGQGTGTATASTGGAAGGSSGGGAGAGGGGAGSGPIGSGLPTGGSNGGGAPTGGTNGTGTGSPQTAAQSGGSEGSSATTSTTSTGSTSNL